MVETVTDLSDISQARQQAEQALIRLGEKHRRLEVYEKVGYPP